MSLPLIEGVAADAVLSPCGAYRYALTRDWFPKDRGHVLWIMLNPSTADADVDDRTVRKCQGFARRWGFDGITVVNLYGLRSKTPTDLWRHHDPVGPENDIVLDLALRSIFTGLVVAGWGANAQRYRATAVVALAQAARCQLHALRVTNTGAPWHPLYIPDTTPPVSWP